MPVKVFKAEDRVIGKIKANKDRRGVIQSVVSRGNKSDYVVVWDNNGGTETVTTRAIDLQPLAMPQVAVSARVDGEGDPEPSDSDSSTSSSSSSKRTQLSELTEPSTSNTGRFHIVRPLSTLPQYDKMKNANSRAKRRCKVPLGPNSSKRCGNHCSFYCIKCSNMVTGKLFCLCGPMAHERLCFYKHCTPTPPT
jgi:hypothetical protein